MSTEENQLNNEIMRIKLMKKFQIKHVSYKLGSRKSFCIHSLTLTFQLFVFVKDAHL